MLCVAHRAILLSTIFFYAKAAVVRIGKDDPDIEDESFDSSIFNIADGNNSSEDTSKSVFSSLLKSFAKERDLDTVNRSLSGEDDHLNNILWQFNQLQDSGHPQIKSEEKEVQYSNYFPDFSDPSTDLKRILSEEYTSFNLSDLSSSQFIPTTRAPSEDLDVIERQHFHLRNRNILDDDPQRLAIPLIGTNSLEDGYEIDPEKLHEGAETINIIVSPNFDGGENDESQVSIFPQSEASGLKSNLSSMTGLDVDKLVEEVSAVVGKIDSPLRVEELHTQITSEDGKPAIYKYTETTAQVLPNEVDSQNPMIEILTKKVKDGEINVNNENNSFSGSSRDVSSDDLRVNVSTKTNIVNIFTFNIIVANTSGNNFSLSRARPFKTKIETTANVNTGLGLNTMSVYKYQAEDADISIKKENGPQVPELEKWLKILLKHQVSGNKEDGSLIQEAILKDVSLLHIPTENVNKPYYRKIENNATEESPESTSTRTPTTTTTSTTTESFYNKIEPLGVYPSSTPPQDSSTFGEIQKFIDSLGFGAIPTLFAGVLATYTLLIGRKRKRRDLENIGDQFSEYPHILSLNENEFISKGKGARAMKWKDNSPDFRLGSMQNLQPGDSVTDTPPVYQTVRTEFYPSSTTVTTIRQPSEGSNSFQISKMKYPLASGLPQSSSKDPLKSTTLMEKWKQMLKVKNQSASPEYFEKTSSSLQRPKDYEPQIIGNDVASSVSTVTEINFVPGKNAPYYSGVKSTEVPPSVWLTAQDILWGVGKGILPNETVTDINPIIFNNKNGLAVTVVEADEEKPESLAKYSANSFLDSDFVNVQDQTTPKTSFPSFANNKPENVLSDKPKLITLSTYQAQNKVISGMQSSSRRPTIPEEVVVNSHEIKTRFSPNLTKTVFKKYPAHKNPISSQPNSSDSPSSDALQEPSGNLGSLEHFVQLFSSSIRPVSESNEDSSILELKNDNRFKVKTGIQQDLPNQGLNSLDELFKFKDENLQQDPDGKVAVTEAATLNEDMFDPTDLLKLGYGFPSSLDSNNQHEITIDKLIMQLQEEYDALGATSDSDSGPKTDVKESTSYNPWVFLSDLNQSKPNTIEVSAASSNQELLELIRNLEREVTQPVTDQPEQKQGTSSSPDVNLDSILLLDNSKPYSSNVDNKLFDLNGLSSVTENTFIEPTPDIDTKNTHGIPQPLFAHLDLRDSTTTTTPPTSGLAGIDLSTTTSAPPSAVNILKNVLSQSAAPLAGLSAASLAYGAAALLPLWLPLALGKKKKKKRRKRESVDFKPLEFKLKY